MANSLASLRVSSVYQCQDHLAKLHGLFDLEYIGSLVFDVTGQSQMPSAHHQMTKLLDDRLLLPGTNYSVKIYLLALRRAAFLSTDLHYCVPEANRTWIFSSRFSRKQKLHKLALSASLQSLPKRPQHNSAILAHTEYAKLLASDEEYHEAIKTLDIVVEGGL